MIRVDFLSKTKQNKEIKIECKGDVQFLVKKGDLVNIGSELFRIRKRSLLESYFLPKVLGIKVESTRDYIGRVEGEYVLEGDLLAERLSSGGLINKRVLAGKDGVISFNRLKNGYLDIVGEYIETITKSTFNGVVNDIVLGEYISFSVEGGNVGYIIDKNVEDKMSDISGELKILGGGDSILNIKSLDDSYENSIVFSGRHMYPELANQLYKRGAKCILTYSIDYLDFRSINVPLVVIGGFGHLTPNKEVHEFIKSSKGSEVKIDIENKEILIVDSPGIDLDKYKGNKFFLSELAEDTQLIVKEGERFGAIAYSQKAVDENLEDGVLVVKIQDGARTVLPNGSVEVFVS
jgi:hypothetical protein